MPRRPTALQVRHGLMATLRANGALTDNGRKTTRQQAPRIPASELPDWRVTLPLPAGLSFSISPDHPTGVIAVTVTRDPTGAPQIEATGKDCQWLFGQVAAYLGKIKNGWQGRMHLRAQRDAYAGCTQGAPLRPAIDRAQDVYLVMEPSLVIPRGHRAPLILKVT
jgi:hypothetical protein